MTLSAPESKKRPRDTMPSSPTDSEHPRQISKLVTPERPIETLLGFLTRHQPTIKFTESLDASGRKSSSLTSNSNYGPENILSLEEWQEFNLETVLQKYGPVLRTPRLVEEVSMSNHRHGAFVSEDAVHNRLAKSVIPIVNRCLDQAHDKADKTRVTTPPSPAVQDLINRGHQYVHIEPAKEARLPGRFSDDRVAINKEGAGCVSIEMKPSTKFSSGRNKRLNKPDANLKQVLSQLNFYMHLRNCRYGCILTDQEIICVCKQVDEEGRDRPGHLKISKPIFQSAFGEREMTIEPSLWYLVMLAGETDPQEGWSLKSLRPTASSSDLDAAAPATDDVDQNGKEAEARSVEGQRNRSMSLPEMEMEMVGHVIGEAEADAGEERESKGRELRTRRKSSQDVHNGSGEDDGEDEGLVSSDAEDSDDDDPHDLNFTPTRRSSNMPSRGYRGGRGATLKKNIIGRGGQ